MFLMDKLGYAYQINDDVQKLIEGIWLEISSNSQITPYFLSTA
jgi:hypothetical protein